MLIEYLFVTGCNDIRLPEKVHFYLESYDKERVKTAKDCSLSSFHGPNTPLNYAPLFYRCRCTFI